MRIFDIMLMSEKASHFITARAGLLKNNTVRIKILIYI